MNTSTKARARIYNPMTSQITDYEETLESIVDLKIQSFDQNRTLSLKETDEKFTLNTLRLKTPQDTTTPKQEYTHFVSKIIQEIQLNHFSKIVAAQKQCFEYNAIDFEACFLRLIDSFPDTFVYMYYIDESIWIGASPEIIGIYHAPIFKTISLAGTTYDVSAHFNSKEKEEQDIVTNYMSELLSQYGSELEISPTDTFKYGDLKHLINQFSLKIENAEIVEALIHQIHPSPALSGLPKQESIDFILKNEPIKRDWYCGLSHFREINGDSYAFAHIRCAKISAQQITYYAGAGIISNSNPEHEYIETCKKIDSLKRILVSE